MVSPLNYVLLIARYSNAVLRMLRKILRTILYIYIYIYMYIYIYVILLCEKAKGKKILQKINRICDEKDEMINDEEVVTIDTKYIETK